MPEQPTMTLYVRRHPEGWQAGFCKGIGGTIGKTREEVVQRMAGLAAQYGAQVKVVDEK